MGKSKKARAHNSNKLSNLLTCRVRTCVVLLSDVALDPHVLQLYPKLVVLKTEDKIALRERCKVEEQSLSSKCSSLFNNVYSLRSEGRMERNVLEDESCIMTRSRSQVRSMMGKRRNVIWSGTSSQPLEARTDTSTLSNDQQGFNQQLTRTSTELFSSRNSDETFIPLTPTCSSDQTQKTVERCTETFSSIKNRLRHKMGPIIGSTANKSFSDYSSEMQNTSVKSVQHEQCDNNEDNNLHSSDNVIDSSTSTQVLPKKDQDDSSVLSNMTDSKIKYEVSTNTTDQTIKLAVLPHLPKIHNNTNESTKKVKRVALKRNKPIIIEDNIVPKGGLSINIVRCTKRTQDNGSLNSSKQISPKQNVYSEKEMKETDGNMDKPINVMKEEKCHPCDINESVSDVRTAKTPLKFHSNKGKDILTRRLQDKVAYNKTINSEETIINERLPIDRTTQLVKSDVKDQISENDTQMGKVCNEPSTDSILTKGTSDLADIGEGCDIVSKSSVPVAEKNAVNRSKKHITKGKIETLNLKSKRRKLNINNWLESQNCSKSKDHEQSTNFSENTTIDPNINSNNVQSKEEVDLRDHLNKKRLKRANTPVSSTSETESKKIRRHSIEKRPIVSETLRRKEKNNIQMDTANNNYVYSQDTLKERQRTNEKKLSTRKDNDVQKNRAIELSTRKDTDVQEKRAIDNKNDTANDDDDCISLFANESFGESYDNILSQSHKSHKFLQSEGPYEMSAKMLDKFMKQNENEFNKEFAKVAEITEENDAVKFVEENKEVNKLALPANSNSAAAIAAQPSSKFPRNKTLSIEEMNLMRFVKGYCFGTLRNSTCPRSYCIYNHNLQDLVHIVQSEGPVVILEVVRNAFTCRFHNLFEKTYVASLSKLPVEEILAIYSMINNVENVKYVHRFTEQSRKLIVHSIIRELLKRQMPLKSIVSELMACIATSKYIYEYQNILTSVESYVKRAEYWNTVRPLILTLQPSKNIVENVLRACVETKNLADVEDVNNTIMNDSVLRLSLDRELVRSFDDLVTETARVSSPVAIISKFGECERVESIASPDSKQNTGSLQAESSNCEFNTTRDERESPRQEGSANKMFYTLQPIDDLPDAKSIYRECANLWKFYADLDRFKKGLMHKDYDYVIDILKSYTDRSGENSLFVRSCCNILRAEVKRSEYHLEQIIQRTVQLGSSGVLGKTLFDIGLYVVNRLMDEEAPRLALSLIQSLKIFGLPLNAEFFLLSTEIYLANYKTLDALDVLKHNNIICTSRAKWHVESTVDDERIRNKIVYILLDFLCVEFVQHAFFLFQFLLKDQSSQYHPIDLSRYADKLIMLSLSSKDTSLITDAGNLVLKYNFALSATPCRALIATLVHTDEALARQIYNFAEGIGIYSSVKLTPVTYIILRTDLTEEEIYLAILQLLKILKLNLGQGIARAKPQHVKVYLYLEVRTKNENFSHTELRNNNNAGTHCTAQQCYNNQSIINTKSLIRNILKNRFDPPMRLMPRGFSKGRVCRVQSKSLLDYLVSEHV